jgi:hypothetical protein
MVEERRGEKGGQGGDSVIGELVGWGCGRGKKGRLICVIGVRAVEDLPEDRQADLSWFGISLNTVQVTC